MEILQHPCSLSTMFSRFIAAITLLSICGPVSAEDVKSRIALVVDNVEYSKELKKPIIWQPVSGGLSRYSLSLPTHGILEAIQFQDTASLFYLSRIDDPGLSLIKSNQGTFDLYSAPNLSRFYYRHPLSPSWSINVGTKLVGDSISPLVGGEIRYITSQRGIQQSAVNLSNSDFDGFFSHTKLNARENLEKIWALSLNSNQSRFGYGLRWFDFIKEDDLLLELGLNNEDGVFGLQLERSFDDASAYVGILTPLTSIKAEAFLGIRYNFQNNANIRLESDYSLLSGSAQSLGALRRVALSSLWRSRIQIRK